MTFTAFAKARDWKRSAYRTAKLLLRRQHEILKAPSIDWQLADRRIVDVRGRLNLRGLDIGARANEDGSGHTLNTEIDVGSDSRTHLHLIAGLREFAEALSLHVDRVFT